MYDFRFASTLDPRYRASLENLLFFNPRQGQVEDQILATVQRFGSPRLLEADGRLRVEVDRFPGVQTLFVFDSRKKPANDLCGVVMYLREGLDTLFVLHISVAAPYGVDGRHAHALLAVRMINQLRRVARSIKGIRYVALAYASGHRRLAV